MDTTHQEQFRLFAFYNAWFNKRLYSAAATLPDRERRLDRDAFFGSIQGTLNHILLTQAGVDVGVTDLIAVTSLYNERRKD